MSKEEVAKDHHTICKIYGGTGRTRIHVPIYGNRDFYRQYEILIELSDGTQLIIWVSEEEFHSIEREIREKGDG